METANIRRSGLAQRGGASQLHRIDGRGLLARVGASVCAVVLLGSALAACTNPAPSTTEVLPDPSSVESAPETRIDQAEQLVDPTRIEVTGFRLVGPTTIDILFVSGSTECFGYQPQVEEDSDTVTLAVLEGGLPGKEDVDCVAVGYSAAMRVELADQVGQRTIAVPAVPAG